MRELVSYSPILSATYIYVIIITVHNTFSVFWGDWLRTYFQSKKISSQRIPIYITKLSSDGTKTSFSLLRNVWQWFMRYSLALCYYFWKYLSNFMLDYYCNWTLSICLFEVCGKYLLVSFIHLSTRLLMVFLIDYMILLHSINISPSLFLNSLSCFIQC